MMVYECWDMWTNNLNDAYESEQEARRALRDVILDQGELVVEFLTLIEDGVKSGESRIIGIGSELLDHARSAA